MKLRNMKIGTQIILAMFFVVVLAIIGLSSSSMYYFSRYVDKALQESARYGMVGMKNFINAEMVRIQEFRDHMAQNEMLADYVANRDTQALHDMVAPLMRTAGIDIVLITDANGIVIARPHTPDRIGDDLSGDETVQMALGGQRWERIMSAPSTRLGYYCGTPIKTKDGEIVGMLRTARSFDNETLVDTIKELYGVEATLFVGSTRFNTTFFRDGKRLVNTEASQPIQQAVLQEGKDVEELISLFEFEYFAVYSPIVDEDTGKIMGMYFCGKPAQDAIEANRAMLANVAVISLVVFIAALLISIVTARRISKPLRQIVALSERGRNGDLTIKKEDFQYKGGGELGALVDALSEMIFAQQRALSKVVLAADEATTHAEALNSFSDENASAMLDSGVLIKKVSELCDVNAQAVARSVTSISEMSRGADSVAKMSIDSADSLAKTTQMSQLAAKAVEGLVNDIKRVSEKTLENQEKIHVLSNSIAEISNFMGVIESIADQTNLLALNAAIEAARAGEAGRGFAVVAEEVRKLAEDSRTASQSVEKLVTLLSRNAGEAISVSKESTAIVSEIMSGADTTADGLSKALNEITNANEAIQAIAAVAQEQAASNSEMSHSIEEIGRSTEEITGTLTKLGQLSEQATDIGISVSNAAQQMAQSASDLKDVLALFRIEEEESKHNALALH